MSVGFQRARRPVLLACLIVALSSAIWWWTQPKRWDDSTHPPPPVARALASYAAGRPQNAEEELRRFLRTYRAPTWEPRARVLAASKMLAYGRAAEIPAFLPAPLAPGEPLSAHADLLRALGFLAARRWEEAATAAATAAAADGFPGREEAVRCQASALEGRGLVREASTLLDRAGSAPYRLEAARMALRHADRDGARRRLASVVLDAPPGDDGERALDTLVGEFRDASLRFTASERPRVLAAARRFKDAGRFQLALDLLEAARTRGASPALVPPGEALLAADLLIRLGRGSFAEPWIARAASGSGADADGARYLRAKIDLARGRSGAYRAGLAALAASRGASPWRLQALADLALILEGKPSEAALGAYRRYRTAAGNAAEPGLLWREAWNAHDLGLGQEADAGIRRVLGRSDAAAGVRAAALYWAGRRAEQAGSPEAARERYREIVARQPNHYYGVLAARRLGLAPPIVPDRRAAPSPDPVSAAARHWLGAARSLRAVDLWEQASSAYRASAAASGNRARLVALEAADGALDRGAEADALQLVLLAVKNRESADLGMLTLRQLRLIVPAREPDRLGKIARAAGLDPALVAGVVLQESAFNPLAVSSAGARGLLQLMPATGEEVARKTGIAPFRPDRLFEPEVNLKLGCAYLKELMTRLGSLHAALAAYNAGASRAVRWSAPGDDPQGERYVERIPIPDTRGYVKRILANVRLYRLAYPEGLGSP